ncbi:MAG TPA: hypothetical protein VFS52_07170 [Steroidobacteraceae bacterium]|nr:hypothetical protein [Steroidobacteraceae bacterium]
MSASTRAAEPHDFSVVLGGPLYQTYRRTHLCGPTLELVVRRIIVLTAVAWLPLLILSIVDGSVLGGAVQPFLLAVDVHARLLVALPLLIAAEISVHKQLSVTSRVFVDRGLVPERARPLLEAATASALRLRNSAVAEVLLLIFVYAVGITFIWRHVGALQIDTWYRHTGARAGITFAGWWYVLVSLPLFQFLLFRWYYRLLIWTGFLWKVARAGLDLVPSHPDRCGGLGFLGISTYALMPLLVAHGALFAGVAASGILFQDRQLVDYWQELFVVTALVLAVALSPMLVFVPTLFRVKRAGLSEYGALAQRYVRQFDSKWIRGAAAENDPLLGSGDIQSLADLANSYATISGMRLIAVSNRTVLQLALATVAPLAPLLLTIYTPRQVAALLLKSLF